MSKKVVCLFLALLMIGGLFTASASSSLSYTYTSQNDPTRIPDPYEAVKIVGQEIGLSEPQDMAVDDNFIYILDAGNSRIQVLSAEDYSYVRTITFKKDGEEFFTLELTGLCVDGDTLLVVDHSNEEVFRTDMKGNVLKEYTTPYDPSLDEVFMPKHVAVDRTGYLYILLDNEYRGLMIMNPDGEFCNYFGSVNVTVTSTVLSNMFWRRFMTEEQIETSTQYVPGGYANVTSDEHGFIYTVRGSTDTSDELVCKLNPSGANVLGYTKHFGDTNTKTATSFTALATDDNGMISVLDGGNKHIFQYSPDGELLYIFGTKSFQEGASNVPQYGTFVTPVDVDYNGTDLLVLDRDSNSLTVMQPTEFGALVQQATILHRKAAFKEAGELWNQVLTLDSNYEKAYIGLGKVAEAAGEYKEAMENYRIGGSRDDYSMAFKKYRTQVLRASFYWIVLGLVIVIVAIVIWRKQAKKKAKTKKSLAYGSKLEYIAYTMRHPIDGFAELRYNQKFSVKYATILALLYFFVSCLNYNYNGYIFNSDTPEDFNMWIVLLSTIGVVALFTLSTWLLSTFLEGKGKFLEVWTVTCYSLIPVIVTSLLSLALSNFMCSDEAFFYGAIQTIGTGWTLILVFISNGQLNQYGFKKNIASLLCAVLGMLIVVFLIFLFFNLWTQLISFVESLYDEITYRRLAAG